MAYLLILLISILKWRIQENQKFHILDFSIEIV